MNRILVSALVGLPFLLASCNEKQNTAKAPVSYPTMKIERADRSLTTNYAATVKGCQTVEIRPQVSGILTEICIKEGDAVKKDQILFEIEPAQFQAAYDIALANVRSAEASVATAQLVLDSNQDLYNEKVISDFELNTAKNDLAEAQAKLSLAKAQLDKASTDLSYTQVKSPVNGVASMIPYRVGALVNSGIIEPLVTVSDDGRVYAYFSMAESDMLDLVHQYGSVDDAIKEMPDVEFRMNNGEMYPVKGHIDAVSGTINSSTGAISFRAVFHNPQRLLRDGGTGTVIIPADYKDCIVVPQGATYELQDKIFVYKVIDNKTVSTEIRVLPNSNGREYIVTEGLEPGDIIISEGAGLLREGTEVNPK
ncbi:MAG: efflux RND transporter periplasmic adaptor subunit [Muribaculaceae bacterium]|nr:efflux RND transporter periplasmic adaptor subunit [Muribaculaceae bacterium]